MRLAKPKWIGPFARLGLLVAVAGGDAAEIEDQVSMVGIPAVMAKVMVSMPDELLAAVDAEASRTGSSRSAVLRSFAEAALRRRRLDRAAAMRTLFGDVASHGGGAAEQVKATRPGR